MTLPTPAPQRQLKHRRQFDVQVFLREDGLWEVDADLVDTKPRDVQLADGSRRSAGTPLHDMLLRLVVDARFNIIQSGAQTRWMPYPGHCERHGAAYERLVGLNLMRGFRAALRERLGGVLGCTHITELAQVLPTAVIQAHAGEALEPHGAGEAQPFQIDGCHALRADGEAVRLYYPRWYRAPDTHPASPRSTE